MTITTISSREFNQDVSRAKRAAETGPVVITDRNEPAYVLLRHADYRQLLGNAPSILQLLAQPGAEEGGAADFDFDPPRMGNVVFRVPDLDDVPAGHRRPVGVAAPLEDGSQGGGVVQWRAASRFVLVGHHHPRNRNRGLADGRA